ncbi:MAG: ATP-binding protein [Saprospiraceae bacterium]
MEKFIQRAVTKKVQKWLDFFPSVAIVGARQAGKTTLARIIAADIDKPNLYLDLESPHDQQKLVDPYLFLKSYESHCVILDEIQRMPRLFELLRGMIDENRQPGRFILLGSASPELLRQGSESLAGRVAFLELTPFLLPEVKEQAPWRQHWFRGGYPESFLAPDDNLSFDWRNAFIQSYVQRDLPLLGFPADPVMGHRFWQMIASAHGTIWNAQPFAASLGVSPPTVRRYFDFLEQAFQVLSLQPYYPNLKKRLVKSPKIYLRDSGVLHALLNLRTFPDLAGNPILGASWEGYVLEQVRGMVQGELELWFYRTQQGTEIDLLLTKGNRVKAAVEIKFSSAPSVSKGFHIALNDVKPEQAFVIVPETEDYPYSADVKIVSLTSFLEKHLPEMMA